MFLLKFKKIYIVYYSLLIGLINFMVFILKIQFLNNINILLFFNDLKIKIVFILFTVVLNNY